MSRKIEFKKDEIIEKAMTVFWEKGYESTSMKDLVDATGLLKGSLYNTFESKENLFLLCLDKYGNYSKSNHYKSGDAGEYLRHFFKRLVDEGVDKNYTKGCLVMNSCLEFANDDSNLTNRSIKLFSSTENNLKSALNSHFGVDKGESEINKIKVIFVTAAFSIREISKFKKDRRFLTEVANNALKEVGKSI